MLRFKQSSSCWEYVVPVMACGHVAPYFVASSTSPFLSLLTSLGAFHLYRWSAIGRTFGRHCHIPVFPTRCLRERNA